MVSEADCSFGTFTSFNIISLMVRRGDGGIAGGVVGRAWTPTPDEHNAITNVINAPANREVIFRSRNFIKGLEPVALFKKKRRTCRWCRGIARCRCAALLIGVLGACSETPR